MNRKKIIILCFLAFITVCCLINLHLIRYGFMQAKGQITMIIESKPIEYYLEMEEFPDSLKEKIRLVQEIKEFAMSIGMNETDNYSTVYDQKGKVILWNLSACNPYSFESVMWKFPFLGSFSYKGFFEIEKAKYEKAKLDSAGFDTRIRPVSAWSTLGWFRDPIMSNMLFRSDGQLAETIFHELTHGTIFIKNEIEFNENLASFIGEQAAISFLTQKYGATSRELTYYLNENVDSDKFRSHLLLGKEKLDSLYHSFKENQPDRSILKEQLIVKIVSSLDTIPFNENYYHHLFEENLPNNAYFMSFQRYHSAKDSLNHEFRNLGSDLRNFIEYYKNKDLKT